MKPFLLFSKLKVVLGFVLTSTAATTWGEALPNSPQPVGLEAITREALDRNPEGRWFLAELEVARSLRKQAGLRPPPEVSGEAGRKSVRGNGLHEEGVAWAASVTQAFEWPGRIRLRKAIADMDIEVAELGLAQFRRTLAGKVRSAAFRVLASRRQTVVTETAASRISELREALIQRDAGGLTPLLEVRLMESLDLDLQRKRDLARLEETKALLELNHLRGATLDTPLELKEEPVLFPSAPTIGDILAAVRTNSFELRQREAELTQQGFKVQLARNERWPAITAGPTISQEEAGDRERIIGLSFSFPIPLFNQNRRNVEAAQARQDQAETLLLTEWRELELKTLLALKTYEAKVAGLNRFSPDAERKLEEAARLADRHFRLGAVPAGTFVELQEKYLEGVENLLETRREAMEAALELEALSGWSGPRGGVIPDSEAKP